MQETTADKASKFYITLLLIAVLAIITLALSTPIVTTMRLASAYAGNGVTAIASSGNARDSLMRALTPAPREGRRWNRTLL